MSAHQPEVCNVLGDSITLQLTAEQTAGQYSVVEFATPGGVGQPPHTHAWDETYLVLEGALDLNVNGESTVINPGSCHQVGTDGVQVAIFAVCHGRMPGGVEEVFKALKTTKNNWGTWPGC